MMTTNARAPFARYRQVVVQPDEDGLVGLVLDLVTLDRRNFVVIKSFARPDTGTLLPAEQTKKLFVGDILLTLNAEPVTSYHAVIQKIIEFSALGTVSYTHLTLPTIYSV